MTFLNLETNEEGHVETPCVRTAPASPLAPFTPADWTLCSVGVSWKAGGVQLELQGLGGGVLV